MPPLFTTTSGSSSRPTSAKNAPSNGEGPGQGLSAGQIAGIVVGSVVGAAILLALLIFACLLFRRKKQRDEKTSLNQPTPPRSGIANKKSRGFEALPGTRVTGITALAGSSASSPHNALHSASNGAGTSSGIDTSPESQRAYGALGMAPLPKRDKSLSDGVDDSSPGSAGYSSGDGAAPAQSEQLDSFKDYYSTDEIHTHDIVSTLWAYQPRANDEFELERGDMLRIVGIWDDGWATGIRVNQRAEDWEPERSAQRDSGVSNGSRPGDSPPTNGDVKAFPLVCVCLPQHWRKTIEGDTTDFSSSE
ncbi:MAG: hypothetical protein M1831_003535 [Alyxoria varia]|nr:MAG: hypothetical protein M1831_003535 [Alyxoria varia]